MRAQTYMDTLHVDDDIRGHHIYKISWTPFVGEILLVQEDHNPEGSFALAILKSGEIVGHAPCEISRIVWYFIEYDGTVSCEVTGPRKQGIGLVVPYCYTFCAKKKLISKLQKKLNKCWYVRRPNPKRLIDCKLGCVYTHIKYFVIIQLTHYM